MATTARNAKGRINFFISKLYTKNLLYLLYFVILAVLALYSYSLIDLNLTLFNHPLWNSFREFIIQIGYFKRDLSIGIYIFLILSLFLLQALALKAKLNPVKIAILIAGVLLVSYPFLSHDFFNYIFDAKILTVYGKNPYLFRALDFPNDPYTRFMHWTHRTYPYGPTFLPITLIPSFLSFGKFILNFLFFKGMFAGFYLLMVFLMNRVNRRWALVLAVNPLIIVEGLVSSHNDLISLSLGIVGIYYLFNKKDLLGRIFFLLSGGIKYLTLPFVILSKEKKLLNYLSLLGIVTGLSYFAFRSEIQSWYFLSLFAFLPFFEDWIFKLNIFFAGLLLAYYPYVFLGGWDKPEKIILKHNIIIAFAILNLFYLIFLNLTRARSSEKKTLPRSR